MRLSSNIHYVLIIYTRVLARLSYDINSLPSCAIRFFTAMVVPHCSRDEDQASIYSNLVSVHRYSKIHRLLSVGKMIHGSVLRSGLEFDVYISNNLLCVYLLSGAVVAAHQMFGKMLVRDSVSWNTMISGFVSLGHFREGFVSFIEMIRLGTFPTHLYPFLLHVQRWEIQFILSKFIALSSDWVFLLFLLWETHS